MRLFFLAILALAASCTHAVKNREIASIADQSAYTQEVLENILQSADRELTSKICSNNNDLFLAHNFKNTIRIYNLNTGSSIEYREGARYIEFSPDCKKLLSLRDKTLKTLDISNKQILSQHNLEQDVQHLKLIWLSPTTVTFTSLFDSSELPTLDIEKGTQKNFKLPFLYQAIQPYKNTFYALEKYYFNKEEKISWPQRLAFYNNGKFQNVNYRFDENYEYNEVLVFDNHYVFSRAPSGHTLMYNEILIVDKKTNAILKKMLGDKLLKISDTQFLYQSPFHSESMQSLKKYNLENPSDEQMLSQKNFSLLSQSVSSPYILTYSTDQNVNSISLIREHMTLAEATKDRSEKYKVTLDYAKTFDGTNLPLRSYFPKNKTPSAMVIYIHGGNPWIGKSEWFDTESDKINQFLANRDYAFTNFTYHGAPIPAAGNYLKLNPSEGRHPEKFLAEEIKDVLAVIEFLKNKYHLPIILHGFSYGGQILNNYLTFGQNNPAVKCAITHAGGWDYKLEVMNPKNVDNNSWYLTKESITPKQMIFDFGERDKPKDEYKGTNIIGYENALKILKAKIAKKVDDPYVFYTPEKPVFSLRNPIDHLTNIKIPTLSVAGSQDYVTPVQHSYVLEKKIKELNLKNIESIINDEGHFIEESGPDYPKFLNKLEAFVQTQCE